MSTPLRAFQGIAVSTLHPPSQEATAAWSSKPNGFGEVGEGRGGMRRGCPPKPWRPAFAAEKVASAE